MKKGPFGKFAVDVDNGFEPYYVVDADKSKKVAELKRLLKDADELFLATDEDREGEAIAWHLLEVLKPKVPVRRMVFHEITRDAIQRAVERDPRARHAARRRPGDPAHPRPALRLRGLARAVAQGPPGPVGRPRAVRRHPARRRAGAGADGVPPGVVLGRRGDFAPRAPTASGAGLRRAARSRSTASGSPPAATSADDGSRCAPPAWHLDEAAATAVADGLARPPTSR